MSQPHSTASRPTSVRPEAAAAVWRWREPGPGKEAKARRLRRQGLVQALVGAAIGGLLAFWHPTFAKVVWVIAGFTLLAALLSPTGLYAGIARALEALGRGIGRVMTVLLLVPVFVLFFGVYGGLGRRGRRDKLERWFDAGASTYWHRRPKAATGTAPYERQF